MEHRWIKTMDKVHEKRNDAKTNDQSQFGIYTTAYKYIIY